MTGKTYFTLCYSTCVHANIDSQKLETLHFSLFNYRKKVIQINKVKEPILRKTEEVRLAESVFKDIKGLQKDLSGINAITGDDIKRKNSWRSQFLNKLEWPSIPN